MIAPCISASDDNKYTKYNDFVGDAQQVAPCFFSGSDTCSALCAGYMIIKYRQECGLDAFGLEDNDCMRSKRKAFRKELNHQLAKELEKYQKGISLYNSPYAGAVALFSVCENI